MPFIGTSTCIHAYNTRKAKGNIILFSMSTHSENTTSCLVNKPKILTGGIYFFLSCRVKKKLGISSSHQQAVEGIRQNRILILFGNKLQYETNGARRGRGGVLLHPFKGRTHTPTHFTHAAATWFFPAVA